VEKAATGRLFSQASFYPRPFSCPRVGSGEEGEEEDGKRKK
jgi:hypothetical protein